MCFQIELYVRTKSFASATNENINGSCIYIHAQVSIAIHEARMSAYCSRSHYLVKNALQALSRKHKLKLEIDCGYYFFRSLDRARRKNSDFIVSLHRMIELEAINQLIN